MLSKSTQILILAALTATSLAVIEKGELDRVIEKAKQNAWSELKDNTWNFPTYLGTFFLSEYYFEL